MNGIGGHAHNDQLSVVLTVNKKNIIIDAGTGYYSGDYKLRHNLRSTRSHNTLVIESHEQNDISKDLFKMIPKTKAKKLNIEQDSFEGIHYGYQTDLGIIYQRKLKLLENQMIITDSINQQTRNSTYIQFVFDNDVTIEVLDSKNLEVKKDGELLELNVIGGKLKIEEQLISKSYGKVIETKKVVITFNSNQVISCFKLK